MTAKPKASKPPKPKQLPLVALSLDGGTQPRAEIDQSLVDEYADDYRAGVDMPPLAVFHDGTAHWLADGFHRYHGAAKAGFETIACEVRTGTIEEARWYSYGANQAHGLRRTNADKRRAVVAALSHPRGMGLSDGTLADYLGVSDHFVGNLRRELSESTPNGSESTEIRAGKDGRKTRTTRIGKRAAEAADADEPAEASSKSASEPAEKSEPSFCNDLDKLIVKHHDAYQTPWCIICSVLDNKLEWARQQGD